MHELLCGKLLGDGCLTKQQGRKPRLQFIHCKKDMGWSVHCYEQLSPFIPLNPPSYRKIVDTRITIGYTESYMVQSKTSEVLCRLYEIWYPNSQKTLPFVYILEHFTDKSLAWWYQDDGHYKHQNGIPRKIILSTDSFSLIENLFLIDFLYKKYGLSFSLDGQNRILLYNQFQIIYFLKLVDPYIHVSMSRKRWVHSEAKEFADRTTIYLPPDITLTKPTAEINEQYKNLSILFTLTEDYKVFFKQYILAPELTVNSKSYQININREYRDILRQIKSQTGLNISQLTAYCFKL